MRRVTFFLTTLVLAALFLAACGAQPTTTSVPNTSVPPATVEATSTTEMTATEAPTSTAEANTTSTPVVPVTGGTAPSQRVTNLIGSSVCGMGGDQLGTVKDVVLDFDQAKLTYVIVDVSGKAVAVPYAFLIRPTTGETGTGSGTGTMATDTPSVAGAGTGTLATDTPSAGSAGTGTLATDTPSASGAVSTATSTTGGGTGTTGTSSSGTGATGAQKCLTLTVGNDLLSKAPAFDQSALPGKGQDATDWDTNIMLYWLGGTPVAATAVPTSTPASTGTTSSTSTPSAAGATSPTAAATETPGVQAMHGVILASELLNSTVVINSQATGTGSTGGTGTGAMATDTPSAGGSSSASSTSTPSSGTGSSGTGTGTGSTVTGGSQGTVQDVIFNPKTTAIQYLVVSLGSADTWIPVPISLVGWDSANSQISLMVDANKLQGAPSFSSSQFPDTTTSGWDEQISSYWSGGGTGTGTSSGGVSVSTATPTP
jgi:sporulation protein YlmC with PRC-barrel domain